MKIIHYVKVNYNIQRIIFQWKIIIHSFKWKVLRNVWIIYSLRINIRKFEQEGSKAEKSQDKRNSFFVKCTRCWGLLIIIIITIATQHFKLPPSCAFKLRLTREKKIEWKRESFANRQFNLECLKFHLLYLNRLLYVRKRHYVDCWNFQSAPYYATKTTKNFWGHENILIT